MNKITQPNCIDIVAPLVSELNGRGLMDHVQLMGGIGSAALKHPGTVIDSDDKLIVASPAFLHRNDDIDRFRENGTLRDIDILVLSDDAEYIGEVETVTQKIIADQLEISVFGLRPISHLEEQRAHPFQWKSVKTSVSDRYIGADDHVIKGLTPFAVDIPKEALESWTLQVGNTFAPVMNPGASLASYMTRSITGLRPKDVKKVEGMARRIAAKWPGVIEWLHDGPGQTHMQFAEVLQTLRRASPWARASREKDVAGVMHVRAGKIQDLREHPAFMFRDAPDSIQEAALALAVFKSRLIGTGESNETIVRLFQKFAEKRLDTITKNQ